MQARKCFLFSQFCHADGEIDGIGAIDGAAGSIARSDDTGRPRLAQAHAAWIETAPISKTVLLVRTFHTHVGWPDLR